MTGRKERDQFQDERLLTFASSLQHSLNLPEPAKQTHNIPTKQRYHQQSYRSFMFPSFRSLLKWFACTVALSVGGVGVGLYLGQTKLIYPSGIPAGRLLLFLPPFSLLPHYTIGAKPFLPFRNRLKRECANTRSIRNAI